MWQKKMLSFETKSVQGEALPVFGELSGYLSVRGVSWREDADDAKLRPALVRNEEPKD